MRSSARAKKSRPERRHSCLQRREQGYFRGFRPGTGCAASAALYAE